MASDQGTCALHEDEATEDQGSEAPDKGDKQFVARAEPAPYRIWGEGLEAEAVKQMANACPLPVAVAGALMPDAHVGYGLPIGGVLATDNAVIPYAVGVDIACRMKMTGARSAGPARSSAIAARLTKALESETRFGVGAIVPAPRQHEVMDADWSVTPLTATLKDKAWSQLGTSGSGNHFVEFGVAHGARRRRRPSAGRVRRAAQPLRQPRHGRAGCAALQQAWRAQLHRSCRRSSKHLAWLDLSSTRRPGVLGRDEPDGPLRGGEPRADPPAHRATRSARGAPRRREPSQLRVEERHRCRRLASAKSSCIARARRRPAPACSASFPARWRRPATSCAARDRRRRCNSASHGAGRRMSRTKAKQTFTWDAGEAVPEASAA